ncbi:MAG: hypothetical protein GVY13_11275 [Alphaproteobacteria bacterium]|jgi:hemolysin activation/secretion protein|nr:hypothetical protein [Alphaproteobacteria bacterium]
MNLREIRPRRTPLLLTRLFIMCLVAFPASSRAQTVPPGIPPAARPDVRLEQELPRPEPGPGPQITVPRAAPSRPPPGAEAIRFTLSDVVVEGATVYDRVALVPAFAPYRGEEIGLDVLYDIAAAIEAQYRRDGYFLTRAILPPQTVEDGVFRVQVIEGYVGDIVVEGTPGRSADLIRRMLAPITQARPLTLAVLERRMLLVNDVPGIAASGLLRPSDGETGAAVLDVTVEEERLEGFAVLGNTARSEFTGPWGATLGGAVNGLAGLGDRLLGIASVGASDGRLGEAVGQINYETRIGSDGAWARGLLSYGASEPGFTLDDFDLETDTLFAQVAVGYPLIRSRRTNLMLEGGFDFVVEDTDGLGEDFSRDRLRVVHVTATAEHIDGWRGANLASLSLRQGLPLLDASDTGDPDNSRLDATGRFTLVRGRASRLQGLAYGFTAYVELAGQYSADNLLPFEQFSVGGREFGRGYDPSELNGDHGVGVTVEMQYNGSRDGDFFENYQAFAFYDFGQVWVNDDGRSGLSLASTGLGIRTNVTDWLDAELTVAKPLTRDSRRSDGGTTNDPEVLFRLVARF